MTVEIEVTVNGRTERDVVAPRMLLCDWLRDGLRLTGTHVGCEQGICGACTVQIDGRAVRSCLTLAVQSHGREVRTVEDLASEDGELSPLQKAFQDCHGLQCGFCTPGFLMAIDAALPPEGPVDDDWVFETLSGNICRCTGYQGIVAAVRQIAGKIGDLGAPSD